MKTPSLAHPPQVLLALLFVLPLLGGCLPATEKPGARAANALQPEPPPPIAPLKTALQDEEQLRFRLDYARLLLDSGRPADAEQLLDKLRQFEEIAADTYPLLAESYERQDKQPLALLAWQEAHKRQPDNQATMARLARSALVCQRYALAESIYQQWLGQSPPGSKRHLAALNNLGFSALLQQHYPQAESLFRQALSLDPLNPRARANLALLGQRKEGTEQSQPLPPAEMP